MIAVAALETSELTEVVLSNAWFNIISL